mmetsp:Transcript_31184/g.97012  ORF Transcript_31184/g.97012 Transcript_31184/m.97012 type:complete len:267 (+) Transcript_31184:1018-1818(+)
MPLGLRTQPLGAWRVADAFVADWPQCGLASEYLLRTPLGRQRRAPSWAAAAAAACLAYAAGTARGTPRLRRWPPAKRLGRAWCPPGGAGSGAISRGSAHCCSCWPPVPRPCRSARPAQRLATLAPALASTRCPPLRAAQGPKARASPARRRARGAPVATRRMAPRPAVHSRRPGAGLAMRGRSLTPRRSIPARLPRAAPQELASPSWRRWPPQSWRPQSAALKPTFEQVGGHAATSFDWSRRAGWGRPAPGSRRRNDTRGQSVSKK